MVIIEYRYPTIGVSMDIPNLYHIVLDYLRKIPDGKVSTYGQIAKALGDIVASRSIGRILALNKWPDIFPCFKVIHSDGKIGKYSGPGGIDKKRYLLMREGINVLNNRIDLKKYLLENNEITMFPYLLSLKKLQQYLATKIKLQSIRNFDPHLVSKVVSCDVAYIEGIPSIAIAACTVFERNKLISSSISILPIFFPYIPGYLAFREAIPILYALESIMEKHRQTADIVLLDGHGILHPRQFGIASHIGVLINKPTIGIAKSLLIGKVDLERKRCYNGKKYFPVKYKGKVLGYCIQKGKSRIFVSPGNNISLDDALTVALNLSWTQRKEPNVMVMPHDMVSVLRKVLLKHKNTILD